MSTTTYTSPVDKLLTFGKAEPVNWEKWPNYLELGLNLEHVPDLTRMATDLELRVPESVAGSNWVTSRRAGTRNPPFDV